MNPYQPPKESSDVSAKSPTYLGRPCPSCGSRDTGEGVLGKRQVHPLNLLFFGWLYLFPLAFSRHTDTCRACGETFSYKTLSSKIAAVLVAVIVLFTIRYFWIDYQRS